MDSTQFNRQAWDNIATSRHRWFTPCTADEIEVAREGQVSFRVTACKTVPARWIGDVKDRRVLVLAGGGGHQGPLLAAAGADVTVVDFSDEQLAIDRRVAETHQLKLKTVCADMSSLDAFGDQHFDLVINPCSVNFVAVVPPVWLEAARVLRVGGVLITGLIQPVNFLFDAGKRDRGQLEVRFRIPYSDLDLPEEERDRTIGPERPIDFGHSLTDLLGAQLAAGFHPTDPPSDR
ncbi:MAG: class I SAM-dependent methyltransferase [Planctomycetota bacterium]